MASLGRESVSPGDSGCVIPLKTELKVIANDADRIPAVRR